MMTTVRRLLGVLLILLAALTVPAAEARANHIDCNMVHWPSFAYAPFPSDDVYMQGKMSVSCTGQVNTIYAEVELWLSVNGIPAVNVDYGIGGCGNCSATFAVTNVHTFSRGDWGHTRGFIEWTDSEGFHRKPVSGWTGYTCEQSGS
jgi:hypothetical protein